MNTNILKRALLCSIMFFCSVSLNASGFALYEFSARSNAMGGAVMAGKAEAASLATNPALITELEGTNLQAGATFIQARATTTADGVARDNDGQKIFALPTFYGTYQAHEHIFLGLAVYPRFGSGNSYPNHAGWRGQEKAYKVKAESMSIVPVIAAKVTPSLSMAVGFEAMYMGLDEHLSRNGDNTKISADGISYGGNISFLYRPEWAEKWSFGASYKSKVRHVVDGTVTSETGLGMPSGDARGSVTLPDMFMAGVSFKPAPKLSLEAGMIYTFWSSYDAIRIDYKDIFIPIPGGGGATTPLSAVDKKSYKDVPRFNIGAEYALNKNWDLRAGYIYDISPINKDHMDTLVPIDDSQLFSVGVGYKKNNWGVDLSYTFQIGKDLFGKTSEGYSMSYTDSYSNMIGITFNYKFDTAFMHTH